MERADALADPSVLDAEEVGQALGADLERGLTAKEAARRLAENGPNELRAAPRPPVWRRILAQFEDPLVYLLMGAILVALVAWFIEGRAGWPVDAIVILIVVLLNGLLGYLQAAKAENAVAALAKMTAVTSAVMRDGHPLRAPSADLVRGDLLLLSEGDAVGADARLISAASLRVQEASLTGESEAVLKDATTLRQPAAIGDRRDMVFKGTTVVRGGGRAIVTATGIDSQIGAIAELLKATAPKPTPLEREIGHLGRMLGLAVIVICVVVAGTILLSSEIRSAHDVITILLLAVSLAVAAVPEGLPATLTVVLALGVQRMAKRNAIVKELSSVETLGAASVIASDKTGTLTRSEMTIERVITASGASHITGVGYAPIGRLEQEDEKHAAMARQEQIIVLSGGSLAGDADLRQSDDGEWEIEGEPTEAAFLVAERKLGLTERRRGRFARIGLIPFTSERKMMSTIEIDREQAGERVIIAKGAPDVLLERCTRLRIGAEVVALDDAWRMRLLADVNALSDAALRTLAVAYRPLAPGALPQALEELERDLIYAGAVGMIDPPRAEAASAIREAHRAGVRVIMITGDHPRTAARIAADLGIVGAGSPVLTGPELDAFDDEDFAKAARETSVYARVAPVHKLRIVAALQANGDVVAMTGDGVNDAPALKAADIGVAMGVNGTEATKEAARMVLADDNFATIVAAVTEGRAIYDNIRKCLRYLLSSNMGEVLTVFLGVVGAAFIGLEGAAGHGGLALPLLATQLLWINLLTDSGPALALGIDPVTDDVMDRRPRRAQERIIDAAMWAEILLTGAAVAVVTLLAIDIYLPGGLIEGSQSLANARTAGFTTLVLAQLFNCFASRSASASAFAHLFVNRWLWGAVAVSAALQVAVVHVPFLNLAMGTAPLTLDQWLVCIGLASLVLWFSEARKLARRSVSRRIAASQRPKPA
ncbi:cation-translocating P-type ATPase [Methylocella silvestris]|uniref:Haloacid dehalogenase n=1 Tax=Methylocella silvestris TaxID=199596 RepID=A0A2J7TK74_METSI|nr:haloacid dehalogenase [Methylocella silvestris]